MYTTLVSPQYRKPLSERQNKFLTTFQGLKFYDDFLTKYGKHIYIFGSTGSGKTMKGYWLVDWLKHRETQIWISTGKSDEILPLFFMGKKLKIVTPARTDVIIEERIAGKWERITENIQTVTAENPSIMLDEIAPGSFSPDRHRIRDTITIFEVRNAFVSSRNAIRWIAELFESLAYKSRLGEMPSIFPASLHVDESQWLMAGKRVSGEGERNRSAETITENAFEMRSKGMRLCFYAQAFKNIPKAARENISCAIICRGGMVDPEENANFAQWCIGLPGRRSPMKYKNFEGRFVFEDGFSSPPKEPWKFPLFPEREEDRERMARMRVRYEGKNDVEKAGDEIDQECQPELGRFSAMAIPPEKIEYFNRYQAEGLTADEK